MAAAAPDSWRAASILAASILVAYWRTTVAAAMQVYLQAYVDNKLCCFAACPEGWMLLSQLAVCCLVPGEDAANAETTLFGFSTSSKMVARHCQGELGWEVFDKEFVGGHGRRLDDQKYIKLCPHKEHLQAPQQTSSHAPTPSKVAILHVLHNISCSQRIVSCSCSVCLARLQMVLVLVLVPLLVLEVSTKIGIT